MSAADEQHYKGEIDITKDLTLPKLLVSAVPEIRFGQSRHEGEGIRNMAARHMDRVS